MTKIATNKEEEKELLNLYYETLFYLEEIENYTTDENIIKQRIKDIKQDINDFNDDLIYDKEAILNDEMLLKAIAQSITGDNDPILFTEERLNDLIYEYDKVNKCVKRDGIKKTKEILDTYNALIPIDDEGNYTLTDDILKKVIKDSNFYISDTETKDEIKKELFMTWENQQEILTQNNLNEYSENRNGLPFKQFVFCEEYIKHGKIKKTCDKLGISRNTAYLWLKDKKVQDYLYGRKEEIKQDNDNVMNSIYNACFNEIKDIISGEYTNTTDKIKAIDTFFKHYASVKRNNDNED